MPAAWSPCRAAAARGLESRDQLLPDSSPTVHQRQALHGTKCRGPAREANQHHRPRWRQNINVRTGSPEPACDFIHDRRSAPAPPSGTLASYRPASTISLRAGPCKSNRMHAALAVAFALPGLNGSRAQEPSIGLVLHRRSSPCACGPPIPRVSPSGCHRQAHRRPTQCDRAEHGRRRRRRGSETSARSRPRTALRSARSPAPPGSTPVIRRAGASTSANTNSSRAARPRPSISCARMSRPA